MLETCWIITCPQRCKRVLHSFGDRN